MPFIPAINAVRLAINYISVTGDEATNVLHFRHTDGDPSATDMQALINLVKTWQAAEWAPVASEDWQTDVYVATRLTVQDDIQVTDIETIPGTAADRTLPSQDTLAMSLRTGFTGRSRRGRLYHVGLTETMVIGSRVQLTYVSQLVDAYQALKDAVSGDDWQWVVASYVSNSVPRETALLTPITTVIVTDTVVDSMDTRKPRAV